MQRDILLIGQGICGSFMYRFLKAAGYSVAVLDEVRNNTASRVASGVINPVTGRRIVKTWLIDEVLPVAKTEYELLGAELGITAISQVSILDFFPTPQITEAFKKRIAEDPEYLELPADPGQFNAFISNDFGFGAISPAYLVNLPEILVACRQQLVDNGDLVEDHFEHASFSQDQSGVHYKDISASKIIFCDGIAGASNPYFQILPFGPNKGEAVLVEIDELPRNHIYKKGFSLVPWKDNLFWLGSNYLWEFDDDSPTPGFYRFAENWLKQTMKVPFRIVDHLAGVRPATLERRPFVGFHPLHPNIGIFNGMGTKGCSLAPFFAKQFVQLISTGTGLYKEANVKRFERVLSRV